MWFYNLFFSGEHAANAVMVISVVSVLGLAFGEIKFGPIHLGIAGPLFIGLALGHFGVKMNMEILGFAREFGLVLFVYAIGMRVGPGFFSAFKKDGALLNVFAFSIVGMGALIAVGIHFAVGLPLEVVTGLFSGGTTNTPKLAAWRTQRDVGKPARLTGANRQTRSRLRGFVPVRHSGHIAHHGPRADVV